MKDKVTGKQKRTEWTVWCRSRPECPWWWRLTKRKGSKKEIKLGSAAKKLFFDNTPENVTLNKRGCSSKSSKTKVEQQEKTTATFIEDGNEVILEVGQSNEFESENEEMPEESDGEELGEIMETVTMPVMMDDAMSQSVNNNATKGIEQRVTAQLNEVRAFHHGMNRDDSDSEVSILPRSKEVIRKERKEEEEGMQRFIDYMEKTRTYTGKNINDSECYAKIYTETRTKIRTNEELAKASNFKNTNCDYFKTNS